MMSMLNRCVPVLLVLCAGAAAAPQWTVGIYMCADNGLNDQAYEDLAEMMEIGSTAEVNIIVQLDNAANDTHPGCRRLRITKDGYENLGELGEVDMADTSTLRDFATFLRGSYGAENYFLVLWDHGNGWYEGYGPARMILIDEQSGHAMGVAGGELAAALNAVRAALGKRVRVLGFDACLMGMVEVAAEVRDACDYVLSSEALVPWGGWPYDELLGALVARPTATPQEFLPGMCAEYLEAYPGEDVCLSALDMRQLDRVLPVLRATLADSVNTTAPGFAAARAAVQPFPASPGHPPCAADDHVDFAHYWQLAPQEGTDALRAVLVPLPVANRAAGLLPEARGMACWFPDNYLAFKARAGSYAGLAFADSVPWLQFLNAYFGVDDVKPAQPTIAGHSLGGYGDVRLWWEPSADFAPVTYDLYEADSTRDALVDYCDNTGNWSALGWRTSERYAHSPSRSFFSGSAPNLDNQLVLAVPLQLPEGGLLSVYTLFDTEEAPDSAGGFERDICYVEWSEGPPWTWLPLDSLYGSAASWQERRYLVPATDQCYLRFRYVTDAGDDRLGVFLDDIRVLRFGSLRHAGVQIVDTTFHLFNVPHDEYGYFLTATDSFGNVSRASQFYTVHVEGLAEPYTRPAPFFGPCELWFDSPPGERSDVRIFTISGTLVREFESVEGPFVIWDGRNAAGRVLADGLYLVVVKGEGFRTVGRIARVSGPGE